MATDFGTVSLGMDDYTSGAGAHASMAAPFFPFQSVVGGGGGGGGQAAWTLRGGRWTNARVIVGTRVVGGGSYTAFPGENYVKVTLGADPSGDSLSVQTSGPSDPDEIVFYVGTVLEGGDGSLRQVDGIYTTPVVFTWS